MGHRTQPIRDLLVPGLAAHANESADLHVTDTGRTRNGTQDKGWVFRRVVTPALSVKLERRDKQQQSDGKNGSDSVQTNPQSSNPRSISVDLTRRPSAGRTNFEGEDRKTGS